jgi:transketolase
LGGKIFMPSRRDLANAIRALSMDAVQKANSGHPGMPLGMADIAEVLWNDYLKHNPVNPKWINRDRFVLSNGHGSMLIFSLLHLSGYDLSMEELKNFRQLHSKTPGHPEYGYTPGVETTTGPLGQGIANAVGMAIAEKTLAAQFNRPAFEKLIDHYTYVFMGDGCMMEGISHEVCSLAGTLKLGKLIVFYDDNGISIDGDVEGWFTDDTAMRFKAYGWHVVEKVDGHDPAAIKAAVHEAQKAVDKPSLICCRTTIGWGCPTKQGKEECHGAPLGIEEIELARRNIGWHHGPFEIPADIYAGWDAREKGAAAEKKWQELFHTYAVKHPDLADELSRRTAASLPSDFEKRTAAFISSVNDKAESIASRKASQNALNGFGTFMPELIGGSADLAGSNLTFWKGSRPINRYNAGNYIYFGVREFGMAAIMNGIALYGGFIPYGATFLMFSEYARNALRMAALMKVQSIFVFTHDSIGLGEDGPTHQAVEQAATLRLIPGMSVWRPCDAVESAVAWKMALQKKEGPTSLLFSRQGLPHQQRSDEQIGLIEKGGYILKNSAGTPDAILIATGSEVSLAMQAASGLEAKGRKIRVVSMPSTDRFDAQDEAYRESVLPAKIRVRVAIEAGVTDGWIKYVGLDGKVIGLNRFGESAPAGILFQYFGFTVDNAIKAVEEQLA